MLIYSTELGEVYEQNTLKPDIAPTISKFGEKIRSLDISPDSALYCAASETSCVHVRSSEGSWGKLTIKKIFGKGDEITKVRFVANRDILILAEDKLFWVKVNKMATLMTMSSWHLLNPVASPDMIPTTFEVFEEASKPTKFCAISIAQVTFYSASVDREVTEDSFQRPCTVLPEDYCKVEKYGTSGVFLVFWGKMLFILKRMDYSGNADHMVGMPELKDNLNSIRYELQESVDTGFKPIFTALFGEFALMMIRRDGKVRLSAIGCHSGLLKRGSYYLPEVVDFKAINGVNMELPGFLSNIENKSFKTPDGASNFFSGSDIKQLRLTPVEQVIQEYVNESDWHTAIKIAVQKFNRLDPNEAGNSPIQNTIRIISVKYIDYFLQSTKLRPGQTSSTSINLTSHDNDNIASGVLTDSFFGGSGGYDSPATLKPASGSSTTAIRLRLIFQMLIHSKNVDFLFETIKDTVQPAAFWRAIAEIVTRYGGFKMDAKYLTEEIVLLPERVVEVLVMNCVRKDTHHSVVNKKPEIASSFDKKSAPEQTQASSVFGLLSNLWPTGQSDTPETNNNNQEKTPQNHILEEQDEKFTRVVHALKRKGYWTCVFKLGLQFPETKVMSLFLTILLSNAFTAASKNPEKASRLFSREYVSAVTASPKAAKQAFDQDEMLTAVVRLFFFLRQIVDLRKTCSQATKEQIWMALIEWMLHPHNLATVEALSLNLHLEVLQELLLIPQVVQSQKMLKHIQRALRPANHWVVVPDQSAAYKTERVMDSQQLQEYSVAVIKELLEYLYNITTHKLSTPSLAISQSVGFFYSKIVKLKPFQQLVSNTAVTIAFLGYALGQKFTPDQFYDKYCLITKNDFEFAISDLYDAMYKVKPKLVTNPVKQQLIELACVSEM